MSYKVTVKNLQENRRRKLKSRHTVCEGPGLWEGASVSLRPTESWRTPSRAGSVGTHHAAPRPQRGLLAQAQGTESGARGRSFRKGPLSFSLPWRERMGRPAARRQESEAERCSHAGGRGGRRHSTLRDRADTLHPRPEGREAGHTYCILPEGGVGSGLQPACGGRRRSPVAPWPQMPNCTMGLLGRSSHHWRAEDSHLLQTSIVTFLDHLSLVIRTMQRFGPPVAR
ncbi:uncharacterized protein [Physeter macrocephalus]|uniref:Uncharacterized protein isoform X1 n=1 Tax=Physeter macrocephalus TaxID=9755 RepID=A0A455ARI0_PHYMC|nr:uncharacterized protein LOC102982262 isoform X1 [Physeter catodon]|eukprot:XP_028338533.1 uncharacterized protein LOC102982262 isoform X1 [Physeter catodon]